jgi:probable FeS assembly SUF system protein SufT
MFGPNTETVCFERDCEVVVIPFGDAYTIPEGTVGALTQALGGSFTVYVNGNLYRVDGRDADAIGREPTAIPELAENASEEDVERLVWEQMKTCYDPEIPVNIVDLGLIYECRVDRRDDGSRRVAIKMTLTAPGCGMGDILVDDVASKVRAIPTVEDVDVELVFDPPWDHSMMSYEAKLETGML